MSCPVERVTGYVDGVLDPPERTEIETHLASCETCRVQAEAERAVRRRLLGLLHPPLPAGLEERVRARVASRPGVRIRLHRVLLPMAAAALLAFVWMRGQPRVVAWEMARDHDHCFGKKQLAAQVWAEDAETVMRWFEGQGTGMPVVPSGAGAHLLVGARYCPFPDLSRTAHLYYRKEGGKGVSVFVLGRTLGPSPDMMQAGGRIVQIKRLGRLTVGVVGHEKEDVEAFMRTFHTTVATR